MMRVNGRGDQNDKGKDGKNESGEIVARMKSRQYSLEIRKMVENKIKNKNEIIQCVRGLMKLA